MSKKNGVSSEMQQALKPTIAFLRRLARYKLDRSLRCRLMELGERKEFLGKKEHDELMALVEFSQNRTLEKLEALVALKRLGAAGAPVGKIAAR